MPTTTATLEEFERHDAIIRACIAKMQPMAPLYWQYLQRIYDLGKIDMELRTEDMGNALQLVENIGKALTLLKSVYVGPSFEDWCMRRLDIDRDTVRKSIFISNAIKYNIDEHI